MLKPKIKTLEQGVKLKVNDESNLMMLVMLF